MGDRWKWSRRKSSSADVSPLVAASLAVWAARQDRTPEVYSIAELVGRMQKEPEAKPGFIPIC
jgi:hypothetical protein